MRNPFLRNHLKEIRPDEILWLILLSSCVVILWCTELLRHDLWHDERHFVETIRRFGQDYLPSLDLLRSYDEMSTPLPFILFGFLGRLVGFDLATMRFFMLILSTLMVFTLYRLVAWVSGSAKWGILMAIFFFFNPYVLGASFCLYTDNPALLFCVLALYFYFRGRQALFGFLAWAAIMSRQYYLFLPLGIIFYEMLRIIKDRRHLAMRLVTPFLSIAAAAPLFLWWNGPAPQTTLREVYLDPRPTFHANAAILYLSLGFWYAAPFCIVLYRRLWSSAFNVLPALLLSLVFFLFPIEATEAAKSGDIHTVGFFHRILVFMAGDPFAQGLFYIGFVATLVPVIHALRGLFGKIKPAPISDQPAVSVLTALLGSFILIMPFSYHVWEKYFVPALLVELILIAVLWKQQATTKYLQPDPVRSIQD